MSHLFSRACLVALRNVALRNVALRVVVLGLLAHGYLPAIFGSSAAAQPPQPQNRSQVTQAETVASEQTDPLQKTIENRAAKVIEQHCIRCHHGPDAAGDLSLALHPSRQTSWDAERFLQVITPQNGQAEMPKESDPLSENEIRTLQQWIREGSGWPEGLELKPPRQWDTNWWSLQPLPSPEQAERLLLQACVDVLPSDNPIDAFIHAKAKQAGLELSPLASRRELIRRLYYDLLGLPPSAEEIQQFEEDQEAMAYERLVDRLLASPRYGERWARHWLDVVHYADTHGYDKDKSRPNAWPYRDYVIRSFNQDKPWSLFIQEQIAGDALFPGSVDGVEALGFLSAGPWDFVGHAEVPETKIDGKIARHLDRDDMVRTAVQSFMGITVGCAQCHDHKFDPISQLEYYQLQAVFAAIDRADRAYYDDPQINMQYAQDVERRKQLELQVQTIQAKLSELGGPALQRLDHRLEVGDKPVELNASPRFGYHSQVSASALATKWIQLNLRSSQPVQSIVLHPAFDLFQEIGPDFGLPPAIIVELANQEDLSQPILRIDWKHESTGDSSVTLTQPLLSQQTLPQPTENPPTSETNLSIKSDENNEQVTIVAPAKSRRPGEPIEIRFARPVPVQWIRIRADRLAQRLPEDFCFALAEVRVMNVQGENLAPLAQLTAQDSIEAAPRWQLINLVDGLFPEVGTRDELSLDEVRQQREVLVKQLLGESQYQLLIETQLDLEQIKAKLKAMPPAKHVYAGTVHHGSGAFSGTGASGGKPRDIYLLHRGEVNSPRELVQPAALGLIAGFSGDLHLTPTASEAKARASLAKWIADRNNSLTWRTVVNRVWQYHFGTGLVDTPNDLGRMGGEPSHRELLDWLAADFRDQGQSLKQLHRRIVTSRTYRQSSAGPSDLDLRLHCHKVDQGNRLLWRSNRRKLDAEAIRDSILQFSGSLDFSMGGPGFQEFVIEKPEHSPHYRYDLHDYKQTNTHRRTIYRFTVRSQLQPFLTSLDCADPSMQVATRNQSQSAIQSLTMLNNGLVLAHSQLFADRLRMLYPSHREEGLSQAIQHAFLEVTGRRLEKEESVALLQFAQQHGLENCCRLLLNLNEFLYVE